MLAGRPVQLFTGDTGGAPGRGAHQDAGVRRGDNIACLIGPLATHGSAGDRRLHPRQAGADAQRRRRRRHDRSAGQLRLVRAAPPRHSAQCSYRDGRLRREGAEATSAPPRSPTISPTATNSTPASSARSRTPAARWCRSCGRRSATPDYGTYIAQIKPNVDCALHRLCRLQRLQVLQAR